MLLLGEHKARSTVNTKATNKYEKPKASINSETFFEIRVFFEKRTRLVKMLISVAFGTLCYTRSMNTWP